MIHYCPTDRILYKGADLDITSYGRAELMGSDHKPGKVIWSVLLYRSLR